MADELTINDFDEAFYLLTYPDIAKAIQERRCPSAWQHYVEFGRDEGRSGAPAFDAEWYERSYPMAAEDIIQGRATTLRDHYRRIGRFRGYLPSANAPRPDNPAAMRYRFGGFWTDFPNALDLVNGKRDIGAITTRQAQLLTNFIRDGYVVLPTAVPDSLSQAALVDFDLAFAGGVPGMKYQIGETSGLPWSAAVRDGPSKALDPHWMSPAIRDLIFAKPVLEFLHLVFERPALASQTLGFLRGSAQDLHQDTAYVPYSIARQFVASWIALEDVTPTAGELRYHPGSHVIDDYLYSGRHKSLNEALRAGAGDQVWAEQSRHLQHLTRQVTERDMSEQTFLAKRGDVLFWAADLVHGGRPVSPLATRKSVVTHYCPAELAPLIWEHRPAVLRNHAGQAYYSTVSY